MVGVTTYSLINQITKNKFYASRESARERIAVRSARSKRRNSERSERHNFDIAGTEIKESEGANRA